MSGVEHAIRIVADCADAHHDDVPHDGPLEFDLHDGASIAGAIEGLVRHWGWREIGGRLVCSECVARAEWPPSGRRPADPSTGYAQHLRARYGAGERA